MKDINEIAEQCCGRLPTGFILSIRFENGCAFVELEENGNNIELPDSADKNLVEQTNDALCVSLGWNV